MSGLKKGGPLGAMYKLANEARRTAAKVKQKKLKKQLKKEEAEGKGPKLETKPAPKIKEVVPKSKKKLLSNQKPASKKGRQEEIDANYVDKDFDRMFWREHSREYRKSQGDESKEMILRKSAENKARSKHPGRVSRRYSADSTYADRGKVARERKADPNKYDYESYVGRH